MAIFGKNPNEKAYTGGKKHFTDVIKNTGSGQFLIWRQPEEDFNTNSTLIVMPGEEAIFVNGGVIEQVFENGTYKLSTENYPFISRLRNAFSGGISTFNCVVYFVRTTHSMELSWGTSTPIQVRDKLLGIATKLRGWGSYKIQVDNPQLFLTKLIGNNVDFQSPQALIDNYFDKEFQGKIKSTITKALNETDTELLGIEARLDEFAEVVEPFFKETFSEYGLKLVKFSISSLSIADDELRRRYDELGMEAIAKLRHAQADKEVIGILGDDWGRQQAVNILGSVADNPGAGGITAAGAGIGMGIAAGGAFGNMANDLLSPTQNQSSSSTNSDPVEVLKKLKEMLDLGLIEKEEYEAKKIEVMGRM